MKLELPKHDGKWVRVNGKLYDLNVESPPESESTEVEKDYEDDFVVTDDETEIKSNLED